MGVQAELVLLLMFASSVKTQGGVQFWRNKVTLTCPGNGGWYEDKNEKELASGTKYEIVYKKPIQYNCKYEDAEGKEKTYLFYVKGKACENCFELDATFFGIAIFVDVIGTAGLMMTIFRCTKKGNSDGPAHSPKPSAPPGSRPPTVPNRDYEQLNPRTRAAETYSTVVNRMG